MTKKFDPNSANKITAAEMIYALKTMGAARFATGIALYVVGRSQWQ